MRVLSLLARAVLIVGTLAGSARAQNPAPAPGAPQQPAAPMTFFITSAGKGDGADLRRARRRGCVVRAAGGRFGAVAVRGRTWHAYLSAARADGKPINARDRIGAGPWHNAKGAMIAANVADLHGDIIKRSQSDQQDELRSTRRARCVNGAGDTPNVHDILTGSDTEGRALPGTDDTTCNNWTSNAATGSAQVGHHDRTGGGSTSWNSAHPSRGCGQQNLVSTGGAGLLYCFAAN